MSMKSSLRSIGQPVPEVPVANVAAIHWVFAEDIDATYDELKSSGANIAEPLERTPWGLRQFTVEDLEGNRFYFHHD